MSRCAAIVAAVLSIASPAAGDTYALTVEITDPDGEVVRARVPLVDGQSHSVILCAEDDHPSQRITVARQGSRLTLSRHVIARHAEVRRPL